jgi:hypothetical protein
MAMDQIIAQVVLLHNIGIWWEHCYFFKSLFTCHQEFGTYGGMRKWFGHIENQQECFKKDVSTTYMVKPWHILYFD